MSAHAVEFWFEFGSSYSYPAVMRIEQEAKLHSRTLVWKPFLLGPIFRSQGWDNSPFNLYPAKGRYMWRDLERLCTELSIPFAKPSVFPRNGLLAARIAVLGQQAEWLPVFVRNVYMANFAHDLDIADADVLRHCFGDLVSNVDAVLAAAEHDETKLQLRNNTERAVELGIFGAPTFMAGPEMFWGSDRLESALNWRQ